MAEMDEKTVVLLKNELDDVREMITEKIQMERSKKEGVMLHLKFTVDANTYYITCKDDTNPKIATSIVFYIDVPYGYPERQPTVYYAPNKILASINVFPSGRQCIGDWHYDEESAANNSSLAGTVRKTVMDIIHEPVVSNYNSVANDKLIQWQKEMTARKKLPTCKVNMLLHSEEYFAAHSGPPSLPKKTGKKCGTAEAVRKQAMPPLPHR